MACLTPWGLPVARGGDAASVLSLVRDVMRVRTFAAAGDFAKVEEIEDGGQRAGGGTLARSNALLSILARRLMSLT